MKYSISESRKSVGTFITVYGFNAEEFVVFIPELCGGYFQALAYAKAWILDRGDK